MGLRVRPLALVSLALAVTAFILTARVGAAPLPATAATVSSRPVASAGANGRVSAIARAGERVYIGGAFTSVGGRPRSGLAAIDAASGQLVGSWRADVTGGPVEALATSPDGGTLYVGGDFSAVGGKARRRLAAVSTASGAVSAWSPAPSGGVVLALAAGSGRVYAGGKFTSVSGLARPYLAALSIAGAVLDWDSHASGPVWALGLGSGGGRLYAGGDFHSIGGRTQRALAGLDTASGADSGWHPRVDCPGLGMAVTPDTVYLVCGGATSGGGNSVLAYSSSTGAKRWSAQGDGNIQGVARLGGVVYAGGHFTTVDGVARKKAAAFADSGGQLLPWDPHPDSSLGVFSMLADGQWLWMGGDFTKVDGVAQPHIARLGLNEAMRDQAGGPPPTLDGSAADRLDGLRSAPLPYQN